MPTISRMVRPFQKTHGKVIDEWVELSERTFSFARYAHIWFAKGDIDTKRAIFAALGSHLIIKDQKLNVELHPYFKVIFENLKQAEKELVKVRTSENALNKRQIAILLTKCPNWRCILEIARTEFAPRSALRGSEWAGGKNERLCRAHSKLPKNLKTNRLELYFGQKRAFLNFPCSVLIYLASLY